jgi:hypothetical protein
MTREIGSSFFIGVFFGSNEIQTFRLTISQLFNKTWRQLILASFLRDEIIYYSLLKNQQPTPNNQQPTTNNQQPTTNNQQTIPLDETSLPPLSNNYCPNAHKLLSW